MIKKTILILSFSTIIAFSEGDFNELDFRCATRLTCAFEQKNFDEAMSLIENGGKFFIDDEESCYLNFNRIGQNTFFVAQVLKRSGIFLKKNKEILNKIMNMEDVNRFFNFKDCSKEPLGSDALEPINFIEKARNNNIKMYWCKNCSRGIHYCPDKSSSNIHLLFQLLGS